MSCDREWAMTLDIVCSVETCATKDSITVRDTTAHGATEGAKKILRYRGWAINRRDNTCPAHSGPIPVCLLCGVDVPKPYGITHATHITGVRLSCLPCHRDALDARVAEYFMVEAQR